METTVTRKGQITIPAELRRKHGIHEGMKLEVLDFESGVLLRPIPSMKDLAGVGKGKYSASDMASSLDRLREGGH